MRNKILIGGEPLEKNFPLKTTDTIYLSLGAESLIKNTSMNMVANKVLLAWAKKRNLKSTNNKSK